MKILVCGDSFSTNSDPRYPDLHFTDQLLKIAPDLEIINLSIHGASNALIQMQVYQALRFNPDAVIISFTDLWRTEISVDYYPEILDSIPEFIRETPAGDGKSTEPMSVQHWNRRRWFTNCWLHDSKKSDNFSKTVMRMCDYDSIIIKNLFVLRACLDTLRLQETPFCYSFGGMRDHVQYQVLLQKNYINSDLFAAYQQQQIPISLWDHQDHRDNCPAFHVSDASIHQQFASECLRILNDDQKHN
jgi:hypothetical protein